MANNEHEKDKSHAQQVCSDLRKGHPRGNIRKRKGLCTWANWLQTTPSSETEIKRSIILGSSEFRNQSSILKDYQYTLSESFKQCLLVTWIRDKGMEKYSKRNGEINDWNHYWNWLTKTAHGYEQTKEYDRIQSKHLNGNKQDTHRGGTMACEQKVTWGNNRVKWWYY